VHRFAGLLLAAGLIFQAGFASAPSRMHEVSLHGRVSCAGAFLTPSLLRTQIAARLGKEGRTPSSAHARRADEGVRPSMEVVSRRLT